jgi:hypothetical protein
MGGAHFVREALAERTDVSENIGEKLYFGNFSPIFVAINSIYGIQPA